MSLQNLSKQNNYNLFARDIGCNNIFANDIDISGLDASIVNAIEVKATDIEVNNIYSPADENVIALNLSVGTQITIGKNLIPIGDAGISLGTGSLRFKDLNIYNIYGPGNTFPVNIQKGILINGASSPNNQSIFGNYFELSSTPSTLASVSGPFASIQIVNYIATRVGNTVSLKLSFNQQTCTTVTSSLLINNFGTIFNDNFAPATNTNFLINVKVSNALGQVCLGKITTTGEINIFDISGNNISFSNGQSVGLGIPNGEYIQINYNL